MLVNNNEIWNQDLEWRKFTIYVGKTRSLLIHQCDSFSVLSLLGINLSMQSNASAPLWPEGTEWKLYHLLEENTAFQNTLQWKITNRYDYQLMDTITAHRATLGQSRTPLTPDATLLLFCLPLFTVSVSIYCYFVCLILFQKNSWWILV